jgi:hypothetical protein
MNALIQARVRKLIDIDELLVSRMFRFADEFGLKITEASIDYAMKVDAFEVPPQGEDPKVLSNVDFISILILLYIVSYRTPHVCSELYLNYLEITFQYKSRLNELRAADMLFYAIFTDRMTKPR